MKKGKCKMTEGNNKCVDIHQQFFLQHESKMRHTEV